MKAWASERSEHSAARATHPAVAKGRLFLMSATYRLATDPGRLSENLSPVSVFTAMSTPLSLALMTIDWHDAADHEAEQAKLRSGGVDEHEFRCNKQR